MVLLFLVTQYVALKRYLQMSVYWVAVRGLLYRWFTDYWKIKNENINSDHQQVNNTFFM